MKRLFVFCAAIFATQHAGAVVMGVNAGDFSSNATIETFSNALVSSNNYDFGNGMTLSSNDNQFINYTGSYGMGTSPSVNGGIDGVGTGYLGTLDTPTTFSLNFDAGINLFGFYGAESVVSDGSLGRDGFLDINFYNTSGILLDPFNVNTLGSHAWEQFHGFQSDVLIGRVEFTVVGHSVFDNVMFENTSVTEPTSLALFGLGLAGLGFGSRKRLA